MERQIVSMASPPKTILAMAGVDPNQLNNLIDDPQYAKEKAVLRKRLLVWIERAEG